MKNALITKLMIVLLLSTSLAGCTGNDENDSLIQTGSSTVLPLRWRGLKTTMGRMSLCLGADRVTALMPF